MEQFVLQFTHTLVINTLYLTL